MVIVPCNLRHLSYLCTAECLPHATHPAPPNTDNTSIWLAAFDKIHLVFLLRGLRRPKGISSTWALPQFLLLPLPWLLLLLLPFSSFVFPPLPSFSFLFPFSSLVPRLPATSIWRHFLWSHFMLSVVVFDNIKVERRLPLSTCRLLPSRAKLNRSKPRQAEPRLSCK